MVTLCVAERPNRGARVLGTAALEALVGRNESEPAAKPAEGKEINKEAFSYPKLNQKLEELKTQTQEYDQQVKGPMMDEAVARTMLNASLKCGGDRKARRVDDWYISPFTCFVRAKHPWDTESPKRKICISVCQSLGTPPHKWYLHFKQCGILGLVVPYDHIRKRGRIAGSKPGGGQILCHSRTDLSFW